MIHTDLIASFNVQMFMSSVLPWSLFFSGAGGKAGAGGKKEEEKPKKEEIKFDAITPESLMLEKAFNKATKKYTKEVVNLKKKQAKEVASVVKSQCNTIEKASKGKKYPTVADVEKDEKIMGMVRDQTNEWTQLMQKHR